MTELDKAAEKIKHLLKIKQTPLWKKLNQGNTNENNDIKRYNEFIYAYNNSSESTRSTLDKVRFKRETSYLLKNS